MLTQAVHVPHVADGQVLGVDGGFALVVQHDGERNCLEVWLQHRDRERLAGVRLDLAGVQALRGLLLDAEPDMIRALVDPMPE